MGDGDNGSGSGIRGDNIYKDNKEELMLALLSDLYSELEVILDKY